MPTSERTFEFPKEQRDQLLPGLPNEVTLSEITSKLPWAAFRMLPSVSRGWQQAIKSGQARSTETLVVLSHTLVRDDFGEDEDAISLYSTRDKSLYQLPPIPTLESGIGRFCQCVALDGKIYIMGRLRRMGRLRLGTNFRDSLEWIWEELQLLKHALTDECYGVEVYVLDVAGRKQWKQCASMQEPRKGFGCGVIDGKIYVFGGTQENSRVLQSEVYDPKADTWSTIAQMRSVRFGHSVVTVGEELFVYGGWIGPANPDRDDLIHAALSLEVYHPLKNEWRVIEPFGRKILEVNDQVKNDWRLIEPFGVEVTERMFMVQGRFYSMNLSGISVHRNDIHINTWTYLYSFSLPEDYRIHAKSFTADECPVLAVGDELLVISPWHNRTTGIKELCLLQSEGFGSKKKELLWEEVNCSLNFSKLLHPPFLCPLQL